MKKIISVIAFIIFLATIFRTTANGATLIIENLIIDQSDTVVFDLSKALIAGNNVSFPIAVLSNDTILSLDFSFKYNQLNLLYDSLVNLNNYMQCLAFYNTNDSTLRFSSNSSVQPFDIDTPLVALYFNILSTQINPSDLDTPKVYLNGTACSFKIIPPVISGINNNFNTIEQVRIFPNPSNGNFNISMPPGSNWEIKDVNGCKVQGTYLAKDKDSMQMDLHTLENGVYFLIIWNNNFSISKKLIIQK